MNQLKVVSIDGQLVTDSRDVAEMIGREHKEVLAMIDGQYHTDGRVKHIGFLPTISESGLFNPSDFFIESSYKSEGNNRTYKCYLLTRKGCDMVANKMTGEKGVLFTAAYVTQFEQMEKELSNKLPSNYKQALLALVEEVEKREQLETKTLVLEQQVSELQPKASYYDLILQNKSLLSVTQIAKDYGMSGTKFNSLLHDLGIQYKQSGIWLLYAQHQANGYTQTSTFVLDDEKSKPLTKWTQKGRLFLYDFLKSKGILPVIEREGRAS